MSKWLLKIVKLFNPIFRRQGVDIDRLYTIVELKLLMDTRRVYMSWKQRQQKENKNHLNTVLLLYGLFGIFMGFAIYQVPLVPGMILLHSFIIFMMAMTLITDFSSVLLDTTDNQIIVPRPVNNKTVFMARLIHILLYLFQFSIAICLMPVISVFWKYGITTGTTLILTSQLTVILAVFFTYILYLLILRFSNEEKIKDIVSYFQIGMTVFFALGYQLIPRLLEFTNLTASFEPRWYSFLLPPVWMAMALEGVHMLNFDRIHIIMFIMALVFPLILFWVMNKYLAPGFSRKLEALGTDSRSDKKPVTDVKGKKGMSALISRIVCSSKLEQGAFEITWKITARDKTFRLQFYPSLGYIPIFIFILVFNGGRNMEEVLQTLPDSNKFLMLIYLPLFSVATSFSIVTFNENFQASWVYHSMPVAKPGHILSGSWKSMIVKFFLPVYLLFFIIALFIWGPGVADDYVLGLCNSLLSLAAVAYLSDHYLPFSRQANVKEQSGKFLNMIIQMFVVGLLVLVHYFLLAYPWIMFAVAVVSAVGCWFMVKNLQLISWKKISV
jgi:hypothetical protein